MPLYLLEELLPLHLGSITSQNFLQSLCICLIHEVLLPDTKVQLTFYYGYHNLPTHDCLLQANVCRATVSLGCDTHSFLFF